MSDRDQFEAWLCDTYEWGNGALNAAFFLGDDETGYYIGGDFMYDGGPCGEALFWAWRGWQAKASREAFKDEQEGDSDLLASAKKLEREVGDIVERLNQPAGDGFMCVPVADLYELQLKSGSPYCYTASSSEAHGWAKEGYPIREYVLLGRLQDAMNHPIDTTPNQYEALGKGGEQ